MNKIYCYNHNFHAQYYLHLKPKSAVEYSINSKYELTRVQYQM